MAKSSAGVNPKPRFGPILDSTAYHFGEGDLGVLIPPFSVVFEARGTVRVECLG